MAKDFLTASDFYRYLQCPHWPYWERFGDKKDRRPLTATEEKRLQGGLEHEKEVMESLDLPWKKIETMNKEEGFKQTLALMKAGEPLIYQGWLVDGDWAGKPDLLKQQEGESAFGDWYYLPVDIKQAHELKKEHKAQLTFYAILLERIQKRFPTRPEIINGDHECLWFDAEEFLDEFNGMKDALEQIRAGEMPEPVYRKACVDTSPWGEACFRLANERNDIALLFNVDVRKLKNLRDLGVRTVEDAAGLDPLALEGKAPGLTLKALQSVQRQAQSLTQESVIVRKSFVDPMNTPSSSPSERGRALEIHFDIESHPPTDTDYLYGFWIRPPAGGKGKEYYHAFVAEKPEDEEKMWKAFLAWLTTLPATYTVFHYAAYEPSRLTILANRYQDQGNPWLGRFKSNLVDLKERARDHATFPLYFYSLKAICKFLGYAWTGDVTNGGQSVEVYDQWRESGDRTLLESIIHYNEHDVRATAFLLDWLRKHAKKETAYLPPFPWVK